jgi:fatty acid desaturase
VSSQNLSHFLVYLIIILLFVLYDRHQELERLYDVSAHQDDALLKCQKAISSQQNYIKLLEVEYIKDNYDHSPIH